MKSFLRSLSLLLAGALATHLAYCFYFNLPININPITVFNIGDGKVEIDNRVNQGVPPAPSPSPATTPTPAATPAATPKTAENAPTPEPQRPEVAEAGRARPGETTAEAIPINRRPTRQAMAHAPDFEEQPQPVYTNYVQPTPVRRRACPIVIARRPPPPEYDEDEDEWEPESPPVSSGRGYSRSHSSSVVTVNGRVVSSSSVTTVNGRVVSRSEYPPPPDDEL